jgi:diguanylate cyclase (GGDEF)-like protein
MPEVRQSRSPRVLVVDDERFMRMQVRQVLLREGYEIIEAETGQAALELFDELRPDVVLMDGLMPDMDGFECCRRLRGRPGGERLPVLMITGLDDRSSIDQAFAAGAEDFVTKPVHWDVLRHRIRRAIERAQLLERLEAANQELGRLAGIDQLTQLANRRSFDQMLAREWRRGGRNGLSLSLVLCDLDHFKRYNDALGHLAGDDCLKRVAAALAGMLRRPADLVSRFGGEEFAIVLPETDLEGASRIAEQAVQVIRDLSIPHPAAPLGRVSISVGSATTVPNPRWAPTRLFAAADEAMYEAKHGGRDASRSVELGSANSSSA